MKTKAVVFATVAILVASYADSASADSHTYTIKKGDTLSAIANKSGTTVAALKQLNSLKSNTIYPNQVLKLSKTTTAPTVRETKKASSGTKSSAKTYKVVAGDNLSKIAAKHKVTVASLKSWNNLKNTVIYPNQVLKVSKSTVTNKPVTKPSPIKDQPSKPKSSATSYIVKKGDTLGHISKAYGISIIQLKQLNNLKSDMIYIGQKLVLSGKASTKPVTKPSPTKDQPSKPSATSYIVKKGDTLGRISKAYRISVTQLKQLNNLKSDIIYIGQKLALSGKASTKPVTKPAQPVTKDKDGVIGSAAFTKKLIEESKKVLGVKYVFGGTTVKGFDCSGFIYYVFNRAGYSMNRQSAAGYYDRSYYVNTPQPGDLVFFENTYKKGISHLGIYIGNNQFINADNSGVRIVSLSNSYYKKHFSSFKRFY